jgi:hypothetical protein
MVGHAIAQHGDPRTWLRDEKAMYVAAPEKAEGRRFDWQGVLTFRGSVRSSTALLS